MIKEDQWMHYIDSRTSKFITVCHLGNMKEIITRRFPLPYETQFHCDTVQIKNEIYFSGGGLAEIPPARETYFPFLMRLTLKQGMDISVTKLPKMIQARANHTMAVLNPLTICVVGGTNSTGLLSSAELYRIDKSLWMRMPSLNEPKKWVSLCPVGGHVLYSFGGCLEELDTTTRLIESCPIPSLGPSPSPTPTPDPAHSALWTPITLTSGATLWHGGFFIGSCEMGAEGILLFGGVIGVSQVDTCFLFNPSAKSLKPAGSLKRTDAFYRTKGIVSSAGLAIAGCHDADLHVFSRATHSWDLMLSAIWNPSFGFAVKSDTV
jgi:hypothetical protein